MDTSFFERKRIGCSDLIVGRTPRDYQFAGEAGEVRVTRRAALTPAS
jgi:hypothetical protein